MTPRALDHLVLPTANLAAARERLTKLGFTVAPEGAHPFGTRNGCVYFSDGTFLEPLAIGDAETVNSAVSGGNSFVIGDRAFRDASGEEGLAALVFKTENADADHEEFARLGAAGGAMVEFSRPAQDMNGNADIATFRLAFAATEAAPHLFFFTCERCRAPMIDRSALERHANGAVRIAAVTAMAQSPQVFAGFLADIARSSPQTLSEGDAAVVLANGALRVLARREGEVRLATITFGVTDLAGTARLLEAASVACEAGEGTLRVPAAPGQGADFVFKEMP